MSEGVVHGIEVYSVGVGPKGSALERFPDIKIIIIIIKLN
jgi:hypothetical protein